MTLVLIQKGRPTLSIVKGLVLDSQLLATASLTLLTRVSFPYRKTSQMMMMRMRSMVMIAANIYTNTYTVCAMHF